MVVFGGCGAPLDQPPIVMVFDMQTGKWKSPQVRSQQVQTLNRWTEGNQGRQMPASDDAFNLHEIAKFLEPMFQQETNVVNLNLH